MIISLSHFSLILNDLIHERILSASSFMFTDDRFSIGKEISIKLEIRPRNVSGLLVMVHSGKDFLVLQLVNGELKFTVDNGNGPVVTSFQPPSPVYFCDNGWHNITGKLIGLQGSFHVSLTSNGFWPQRF